MRLLRAGMTSILLGVTAPLFSATYYIDFAAGDNQADGRTPEQAWKHAPLDRNAEGVPAETDLQPGDTLIFKGGVAYRGEIVVEVSGEAGKPITLDGNTAGTFGEGRAILDGGQAVEGWEPVTSAEQVRGNPKWEQMFTAVIPVDIAPNLTHDQVVLHRKAGRNVRAPWQRVILSDGDEGTLPIAQIPKPADDFFPDLPQDFFRTSHKMDVRRDEGVTVITDPDHLTATEPDAYNHMVIGVHGGNNHVYFANVQGFDPENHQLRFPVFSHRLYDTTRWALYNAPELIENPGEWSIQDEGDGTARIFLLPRHTVNGLPDNIAFAKLGTGVEIREGAKYIYLQGLIIQRYAGGGGGIRVARNSPRSSHILIDNCTVRWVSGDAAIGLNYCDHIVIRNSSSYHCPGWTTSIFANRVNDYVFENNRFDKNSGSGIRHYECKRGELRGNVILRHHGMHSESMNIYEGCEDLTVERNVLHYGITINRNANRITIRDNILDGMGTEPRGIAFWPSGSVGGRNITDILIENNTIVNQNLNVNWMSSVFYNRHGNPPMPTGVVIRNNILERLNGLPSGFEVSGNVLLNPSRPESLMDTNTLIEDRDELFVNADEGDFRRRPGAPHPEAGARRQ